MAQQPWPATQISQQAFQRSRQCSSRISRPCVAQARHAVYGRGGAASAQHDGKSIGDIDQAVKLSP